MKIFLYTSFVVSIIFSTSINAQDLTSIDVESSILSESRSPVSIVDGKDIVSSKSLGSNLRHIPGVANSDYGAAIGQPIIRGLGGSRVRVLSNNNYVSDLSFFSADHPVTLNLNHASHIEIIKGPSSLFNFSGTTGGIVNVITGSSTDKLYSDEIISFQRSYDSVSEGYSNSFLLKKNLTISLCISHKIKEIILITTYQVHHCTKMVRKFTL